MDSRTITPDMARAELARRELARRGVSIDSQSNKEGINRFQYETGINRTPIDTARDLTAGAIGGLGKGGQFIANKLTGGYAPKIDWDQIESSIASPNKSMGGQIIKGIGEYAPYGLAGGSGLLGELGAGASYGAATAQPNQQNLGGVLPSGSTGSAIESAGLNALTHGAFSAFNALRPSNLLRGNLSPEELQSNVQAARGTPTGLGDVIGSPFLKRQYENIASKLPFSGSNEKLTQSGQAVQSKGNKILSNLLGVNDPENVTDQINDALTDQFHLHQNIKNNMYEDFNKTSEENNEKPNFTNFKSELNKNKNSIDNLNILRGDPLNSSLFDKISNYLGSNQEPNPNTSSVLGPNGLPQEYVPYTSSVLGPNGLPQEYVPYTSSVLGPNGLPQEYVPYTSSVLVPNGLPQEYVPYTSSVLGPNGLPQEYVPSYREANYLASALNRAANEAKYNPNERAVAGVYRSLGNALKNDVKESVSNSNNPKLINKFNQAEENYENNFSQFLDKDIYKYASGKNDPDMIVQSFLKNSKSSDRANLLEKLTKAMPLSQKGLIPYAYFSRALDNEGNLNSGKLSTLIKNLGKNQFKSLVPDQSIRNQLKNYNKLYGMNVKGVNLMQNQATGQQALDIIPSLMAHAGTTLTGGALGGIPGALAGLLAPGITMRSLVNLNTSPSVRESLVKAMIANKPWNKNVVPAIQTGIQGMNKR